MGIADIKSAFAKIADGKASCTLARLSYVKQDGQDWQKLTLDVTAKGWRRQFEKVISPMASPTEAAREMADEALGWAAELSPLG